DASDLIEQQLRLEAAQEAKKLRLQSQPLQRSLPRPFALSKEFSDFQSEQRDPALKQAEELLHQEVIQLIRYEAAEFPYKQSRVPELSTYDDFSEEAIHSAREMIQAETELVKKQ